MDIQKILNKAFELTKKDENNQYQIYDVVFNAYKIYVGEQYPQNLIAWPMISGSDILIGSHKENIVIIFKHTATPNMKSINGINEIALNLTPTEEKNIELVRKEIKHIFNLNPHDAVFIVDKKLSPEFLQSEILINFKDHQITMNKVPMKIFLSHKGTNKKIVRKYNDVLKTLGFSPWLDEEDMTAGSNLNRAILQGVDNSCATVFFITDDYQDENYLSDEVDYSIERTKTDSNFKIITLVFGDNSNKVPKLLKKFVWKEVENDLDGLHHILKALPLEVGKVSFKHD